VTSEVIATKALVGELTAVVRETTLFARFLTLAPTLVGKPRGKIAIGDHVPETALERARNRAATKEMRILQSRRHEDTIHESTLVGGSTGAFIRRPVTSHIVATKALVVELTAVVRETCTLCCTTLCINTAPESGEIAIAHHVPEAAYEVVRHTAAFEEGSRILLRIQIQSTLAHPHCSAAHPQDSNHTGHHL